MTNLYARVIADSISPNGDRLTTIECRFHRFILPEVNTHRMLSKSAMSSRAIPIAKRIEEVRIHPAVPVHWGKNQKGMVAEEEIEDTESARLAWVEAANSAADQAEALMGLGIHKQVAARVLEPFLYQTNVMSSTNMGWENLLRLRNHPDAQPEFQALALLLAEVYRNSRPVEVGYGEWHLPYVTEQERNTVDIRDLKKISVARVARTSYGNSGGFDMEKDLELENRLFSANPRHDAPFEMVATPAAGDANPLGNFKGWEQFRHNMDDR